MSTIDAPVGERERLDYLDILRGFAVLAIFVVNIKAMFQPFAFYSNATLWAGEYDVTIAAIQAFLVEDKWRTIFTALFGAGLALIAEKAAARGHDSLGLLSRRLFFLLIFGLMHLLLMWMGDILTIYALTGFLAMWFRNAAAKSLRRWFIGCLVVAFLWTGAFAILPAEIPEIRAEVEPMLWGTDPAYLEKSTSEMLAGVGEQIATRVGMAGEFIAMYFLAGGFWLQTLGIMLAGMWAYRTGYLTGKLPLSAYAKAAIIGALIAVGLDTTRWLTLNAQGWTFDAYSWTQPLNMLDGYAGAVAWSGIVGVLVKLGWRARAFAATGRMAFTNYIACTLIGTTLANGHGFGLFGAPTNLQLMGVVLATWLAVLIWSPLWLARFRFGPLEWLWRSLTYGRVQPFQRRVAQTV
ncbi:MAG: DUF418 domain-containing protein [Pseudomonadota bacterium]